MEKINAVENLKTWFKELSSKKSNEKFKKLIILFCFIGIGLIFVSSFSSKNKHTEKPKTKQIAISTDDYTKKLEEDLKNMIMSIKGAGETKVLVTLESSTQTIYATEEKKNNQATHDNLDEKTSKTKESTDSEIKYIKVKGADGSEKALSVTEIQPTIKGVVVVCKGGDNPGVQKKIVDAVRTALNITSKRVFVTT